MTSKKLTIFGSVSAAAIAVVLLMPVVAMAETNPQQVSGTVGEQFNASSNTSTTGSATWGQSGATFDASGKHSANGSAASSGFGNNTHTATPAKSVSAADGGVGSFAKTDGRTNNVSVSGNVGQQNGVGKSANPTNGGIAFNKTTGGYNGSAKESKPLQLSGNTDVSGQSTVATNRSPTQASTTVQTIGSAASGLDFDPSSRGSDCHKGAAPKLSTSVNGSGGVEAQSFLGNPNGSYSGATLTGSAQFGANGGSHSTGSLGLNGQTSSTLSPNGTSATANSSLTTYAKGW